MTFEPIKHKKTKKKTFHTYHKTYKPLLRQIPISNLPTDGPMDGQAQYIIETVSLFKNKLIGNNQTHFLSKDD